MSQPVYSDFAARFPELVVSPVPDAARQAWILARLTADWGCTSSAAWGTLRSEATLLKTAHRYALRKEREGPRGVTGNLVTDFVSEAGRRWSDPAAGAKAGDGDAYWRRSVFGAEYLDLRGIVCGSGPDWGLV